MRRQMLADKARGATREEMLEAVDQLGAHAEQLRKDVKWARAQVNALFAGG